MNELDFLTQLDSNDIKDNPIFDVFGWQFNSSLPDADTEEEMYWHGRLIGPLIEDVQARRLKPYQIYFMRRNFNERQWRLALRTGEVKITELKFETMAPNYVAENTPSILYPTAVTYTAILNGSILNPITSVREPFTNQRVSVTHHIRQTYIAYETVISAVPPQPE